MTGAVTAGGGAGASTGGGGAGAITGGGAGGGGAGARVVGGVAHADNAAAMTAVPHAVVQALTNRAENRSEMNGRTTKSTSGTTVVTGASASTASLIEASGLAAQDLPAGALYVVATPIGNLADLTLRAWWVLSHVDAIAAEDTRTTRRLLERYAIREPAEGLLATHEHNERASSERIVARLRDGARVALVSDAGTPAVSDPGARVVRAVLDAGLRVVPVPGASSLTATLSIGGESYGGDSSAVTFAGFLPSGAKLREARLRELAARGDAFVLFEAPHRLAATAAELAKVLAPDRRVLVARELTKKFETVTALTAAALVAFARDDEPRGEYVLLVESVRAAASETSESTPPALIDATTRRWLAALRDSLPASRAAAVAAKATGLPRDLLYRELAARGDDPDDDA